MHDGAFSRVTPALLFLLLPLFSVAARRDGTCGSTLPSTGISGHDLGGKPATSASLCCTACLSVPACVAAVWASDQSVCYLKSAGYQTMPAAAGSWVVTRGLPPAPGHPPARTIWPLPTNYTYDTTGPWPTFSGIQQRAVLAPSFDIACTVRGEEGGGH